MDILETMERLFDQHPPETLLAFFGATTSMLLFSLVWFLSRYFFRLLMRESTQDAQQDQAMSVLLESVIGALVSEAGHLRQTLDGILQESLRCGEQNAQVLALLLVKSERLPADVLQVLKPEFEHLHQEMLQVEARLTAKYTEVAASPNGNDAEQNIYEGNDKNSP
jgi:dsRNA-specific ribonuclease